MRDPAQVAHNLKKPFLWLLFALFKYNCITDANFDIFLN